MILANYFVLDVQSAIRFTPEEKRKKKTTLSQKQERAKSVGKLLMTDDPTRGIVKVLFLRYHRPNIVSYNELN